MAMRKHEQHRYDWQIQCASVQSLLPDVLEMNAHAVLQALVCMQSETTRIADSSIKRKVFRPSDGIWHTIDHRGS